MTGLLDALVHSLPPAQGYWGWVFTLLLEVAVKGAILLLLAAALAVILQRSSAASRHMVWTLALGAALVLPVLTLTLPSWHVAILPVTPAATASGPVTAKGDSAAIPQNSQAISAGVQQQPAIPAWDSGLLLLWAAGLALFIARMAVGELRVHRLVSRSQPFESRTAKSILEEISRSFHSGRIVELRTTSEIGIPFTRGVVHPAVFLPDEARHWPQKHLELVLAHEFAHVHRHDYLTQILAQSACALLWFHPLVWLAAVQMRKERERACDDMVLNLGHRATDYGEFLLSLSRRLRHLEPVWSTGIAMAQSSQLEVRMKALLNSRLNHRPLAARSVTLAAILAAALLVPTAAIHATAKDATGTISGTVFGPGREAISGAKATLTDLRTLKQVSTLTAQYGRFEFSNIRVGGYKLEITKPGYISVVMPAIGVASSHSLQVFVTINPRSKGKPSTPSQAQGYVPQRIRVGGEVEARKLIYRPSFKYPPLAKRAGIQGKVMLDASIAKDGTVKDLRVLSGHPLLVKAALDAVRHWRYKPTYIKGVPVEVETTVQVNFKLSK